MISTTGAVSQPLIVWRRRPSAMRRDRLRIKGECGIEVK